jgi:hypothetical protein
MLEGNVMLARYAELPALVEQGGVVGRKEGSGHFSVRMPRFEPPPPPSPIEADILSLKERCSALQAVVQDQRAELERVRSSAYDEILIDPSGTATFEEIVLAVCAEFDVTVNELMGERRARHIARPRQVVYWVAKRLTRLSFPNIGRRLGGRDHTTIMHGAKKVELERRKSKTFTEQTDRLMAAIPGHMKQRAERNLGDLPENDNED